MIARVVGLLTVVAALFSWMGGLTQSMSPPQPSVETPRQRIESRTIELPGSGTESRTESDRNGSAPEEWDCTSQTRTWKYIVLHHTAT
ncbi:MAG TPA: hypothetical protein VMM56_09660, partial [Planctomycetaceae bacterium]|nr:hypothetical protein [Planctomycetaceae bacterium]